MLPLRSLVAGDALCKVDVGRENVAQSPKSDFHDDANEFPNVMVRVQAQSFHRG